MKKAQHRAAAPQRRTAQHVAAAPHRVAAQPTPWWAPRAPIALVASAAACLVVLLAPEIPPPPVYTNDFVLHLSLVRGLESNRTLDFWHGTDLGYPVLRLYQPFYHLLVALLDGVTFGTVGLPWLAQAMLLVLAILLPAGVFLGIRRWLAYEGLPPSAAAWAAAITALLGTFSCSFTGFGYDPLQGIYVRYGVITQTWSMVFFAPAFGWTVGYLTAAEGSPWPALGLSLLVWGFSLIIGVMLAMCVALRAVLEAFLRWDRRGLLRLARYCAGLLVVTAFLWWPMIADLPWIHYPKTFFARWVNEGFGHQAAFHALFTGALLDGVSLQQRGRVPVMTLLLAVGAVACLGLWRKRPALTAFLLAGYVLWFTLFEGKEEWGAVLYALPLLKSYQWGRTETMLQFWATVIAAVGIVQIWPHLWSRLPRPGRVVPVIVAAALVVMLAQLPFATSSRDRTILSAARSGRGGPLVEKVASQVRAADTRTYVGGPTTWEAKLVTDQVWPGVALVGEGIQAAGRIYQGMSLASGLLYMWDGKSKWGADLLSIGHWLAPCDQAGALPIAQPTLAVSPGICLGAAAAAPPLAFFSTLATTPPTTLTEDEVLEQQRVLLGEPEKDVFLPFRLGSHSAAPNVPASFAALRPLACTGSRFERVAPGVTASRVSAEAPAEGAIVFPVPFHPRLRGVVDGRDTPPIPVLPGYAAVPVPAGHHDVVLVYRTDRVKDVLFVASVIALVIGPVASRLKKRLQPNNLHSVEARTAGQGGAGHPWHRNRRLSHGPPRT